MRPERWLVLRLRVPSDELREELAEGLVALGGSAVEETGDHLTTYIAEPADPDGFVAAAAERLAPLADGPPELEWRWQTDEDWSVRWKEGLAPRRLGRITVTQPWNAVAEEEGGIVVVIDPASAFGTGEHATTRGALRLLQERIEGGERVLDVGTGSGILAIAAVRLGAGHVLAAELDEGSIETARENLARNGVSDSVELVQQRVDGFWLNAIRGQGFDLIAANVLSGVLVPLLPALAGALSPGGDLILGGILDGEAADLVTTARAAGLTPVREDREGEWWTGLFEAPASSL